MNTEGAKVESSNWKWLTLATLCIFAIIGSLTFNDYGMSWDQSTRWNSGDWKIEYYKQLWEADDKLEFIRGYHTDNYPGLYDMSLSLLSQWTSYDRLALDQIMTFAFAFGLLLAVSMLARKLGDWKLAFFASLFLLCMPRVYGHAFINPKDIPFAATYWISLLAIYSLFERTDTIPEWRKVILTGFAIGCCLGTRIAGLVLFCYVGIFVIHQACHWLKNRKALKSFVLSWVTRLTAMIGIAYAILIPFWPGIHKSPFGASARILDKLHSISGQIPLLYRGEVYDAGATPRDYAIGITLLTTPLFLLALLGLGLALALVSTRDRKSTGFRISRNHILGFICLFPFLYITASQPSIHNGSRHLLFALPAIALGAAVAFNSLETRLSSRRPLFLVLPKAAVGIFVFLQIAWLAQYHPYQYVYFNTLTGGPAKAWRNYEFEYWFTANREAYEKLLLHLEETNDARLVADQPISLLVPGPEATVSYFADERFTFTRNPLEADFFVSGTTLQTHTLVEGESLLTVERNGIPLSVVKDLSRKPK